MPRRCTCVTRWWRSGTTTTSATTRGATAPSATTRRATGRGRCACRGRRRPARSGCRSGCATRPTRRSRGGRSRSATWPSWSSSTRGSSGATGRPATTEAPPLDDPASFAARRRAAGVAARAPAPTSTRPWAIVASGVVVNELELPWPRAAALDEPTAAERLRHPRRARHARRPVGRLSGRARRLRLDGSPSGPTAGGRTVLLSGDVHSSWAFIGPDRPSGRRAGGRRVHDAGGVVGGDGPRPLPGAVAGARPGGQRTRPRRVVRRHEPRATRSSRSRPDEVRSDWWFVHPYDEDPPPRPSWPRCS